MKTNPIRAAKVSTVLVLGSLLSTGIQTHTTSVGYESAEPGSVTFWYSNYHGGVSATEGSLLVTSTGGYSATVPFTLLVGIKPTGLIDGTPTFTPMAPL